MAKLTIDVPDQLVIRVRSSGHSIESVLLEALAHYVDNELPEEDVTQKELWQLCGRFSISEADDSSENSEDGGGSKTTNYAEQIDSVLYNGF